MISDSIYRHLTQDAGVSALVSTRVYPVVIPQNKRGDTDMPCLSFSIDTNERQVRFSGSDTLVSGFLNIDCFSDDYDEVQSLAAALRSALIDLSGSIQGDTSPISSVSVQRVFLESERSLEDPEPGLYHISQRYTIWYDEA